MLDVTEKYLVTDFRPILQSHQNSSSDHGSSGMPQGPRLVFDKASSREDSGENSSNKVSFS